MPILSICKLTIQLQDTYIMRMHKGEYVHYVCQMQGPENAESFSKNKLTVHYLKTRHS